MNIDSATSMRDDLFDHTWYVKKFSRRRGVPMVHYNVEDHLRNLHDEKRLGSTIRYAALHNYKRWN